MSFSISLSADERNTILDYYRQHPDPSVRLRAHIILLLADGHAWSLITNMLFCSSQTVARWKTRFEQGRVPALLGKKRGAPPRYGVYWVSLVIGWITHQVPRDFGFLRSRWCCGTVALLLWQLHRLPVSRETIRRWLHRQQLVWRRPRPVLKPKDPEKPAILQRLRQQMARTAADEVWVFEDEVDVNTNPKIGCMWMRRGQQATVETPGNNEKRYLAGSQNWRTGAVIVTEGQPKEGRSARLFVRHLHELGCRLRRYRKIHVLCDNAKAHDCRLVHRYLFEAGGRIVLHYLPRYAPETNPIERVWWHLHEEITRNHRCQTMPELLELVFAWLKTRRFAKIEGSLYPLPKVA